MVQKYSIFAAIQASDVMRNAYLINLVHVLCGLPVSGDSTGESSNTSVGRKEAFLRFALMEVTMTWGWKMRSHDPLYMSDDEGMHNSQKIIII